MERFDRYMRAIRPTASPPPSTSDETKRPTRLTFRRQCMDMLVVASALFAAVIVLNESANRQWSVAVGPSYRQGQQYAAVAATWAHEKLKTATDAALIPALRPETLRGEPEIALAMEDIEDSLRLEDPRLEVAQDAPSVPTVGTLQLQTVGRSLTLHSRSVDADETDRDLAPAIPTEAALEEFKVQLRLE